jgi:hypothetical protein
MKKLLLTLALLVSTLAHADYSVIVNGPGGWPGIIVPELSKALGEPIRLEIIPGGGGYGIASGNKWHEKLRYDNNNIWHSSGGNGEAFLLDEVVKYNYKDYEPILAQNLTITVGYDKNFDPYNGMIKFASGAGMTPDVMGIMLMVCGNLPNMKAYLECYKKHITYVKGMTQPEQSLAYAREELTAIRQNPFDYKEQFAPLAFNVTWFTAGLVDVKTGKIVPDTNYPVGVRSLPEAFKAKWGKEPKGEFYEAWVLSKYYRDVLQKMLWVNKGNPNRDKLVAAARKMVNDPVSQKIISDKLGTYPWWVGDEVNKATAVLDKQLTLTNLKNLVWWCNEALGVQATLKPEIVSKAK